MVDNVEICIMLECGGGDCVEGEIPQRKINIRLLNTGHSKSSKTAEKYIKKNLAVSLHFSQANIT